MKKSFFLTMAVFAVTLFCGQFVSAQWVVCNGDVQRNRDIFVSAPYFSVDFISEINTEDGDAVAGANWLDLMSRWHHFYKWCPYDCGFSNIGTQTGGNIIVNISCASWGSNSYAKAELWQW
jgi:hypothetical protein